MKKIFTLFLAALLLFSLSLSLLSCGSDDGESSSDGGNPPVENQTYSNQYLSFEYPGNFSKMGENSGSVMFVDMMTGAVITLTYHEVTADAEAMASLDMREIFGLSDAEVIESLQDAESYSEIKNFSAIRSSRYVKYTFTGIADVATIYQTQYYTYKPVDGGYLLITVTIGELESSFSVAGTVLGSLR